MKKTMPVGYEDFKEVIEKDLYYVDKTQMIKEILDRGGKVNLFTRPRRFGKTLNLSMLRRFFELEIDEDKKQVKNGYLFEQLKIASCGEDYMAHQGKYPVINLSLKSAKQPDYELAYESMIDEIAKEYRRHDYILGTAKLTSAEKERYEAVMNRRAERIEYAKALEFLSYCLAKYHRENVIILIDEYDVPLENSYFEGFYDKMAAFIRSLFESALKTNPYLEFAAITGCLCISRESIFTGLNNLKIFSVITPGFSDCFGFLDSEVRVMLDYYGLTGKYGEIKEWYNGYRFGKLDIYNPWSIINYVDTAVQDEQSFPKPYWSNTSSNSVIKEMVQDADFETREEIEKLIAGDTIEKPVHEDITYGDIHESMDNLWNFLFFTGYLKKAGERQQEETNLLRLAIPNAEIRYIYRNTIMTWFEQKIKSMNMAPFFHAIEQGDCDAIGNFISAQLMETISFYDYSENYYHGFLVGLLKTSGIFGVYSNRESGTGRSDIILKTHAVRGGKAVILELKAVKKFALMEDACEQALMQIEERNYAESLRSEGYQDIRKYGIAFYKKECLVKAAEPAVL